MKRLHLGLLEFVPLRSTILRCAAEACEHMLLQFPRACECMPQAALDPAIWELKKKLADRY